MVGGGGEELGAVVVVAGCGGGSGAGRGRGLLLLLLSRCLVSNCSGSPPCWLELAHLPQIGVGGAPLRLGIPLYNYYLVTVVVDLVVLASPRFSQPGETSVRFSQSSKPGASYASFRPH